MLLLRYVSSDLVSLNLYLQSPRRNCCRVLESKRRSLVLEVDVCGEGEIAEI